MTAIVTPGATPMENVSVNGQVKLTRLGQAKLTHPGQLPQLLTA